MEGNLVSTLQISLWAQTGDAEEASAKLSAQAELGRHAAAHAARTNPLLPNLVALPSYSVAPIMA
jgi:hypothetical protein